MGAANLFLAPGAVYNLVTPLHRTHHDCLAKMAKFVYKNTWPSAANCHSQNIEVI